ncbi:MAG: pseudouridine synthase [Thermoplasmatota archaeon]
MTSLRLQRYLARAGLGSRRSCEELITSGRVAVNGVVVDQLGTVVEEVDEITLDGIAIKPHPPRYFILNKPRGVISVNKDVHGRRWVVDLIPGGRKMGLFPVGRLDVDTTGLMIITNDGELANRISHPRYEVGKTYTALVSGRMSDETLKGMEKGVLIDNGEVVEGIRIIDHHHVEDKTMVRLSIHEGRYHVVRRIFLAVRHRVRELRRDAVGGLELGDLPEESFLEFDREELVERIGL